jgi:hypothetical protein
LSRESRSFAGRLDLVGLGERLEQRLRIRNLREFRRRRTAFMDQIAGHYRRGRGRSRDGLEAGLWQQVDRFVKLDAQVRGGSAGDDEGPCQDNSGGVRAVLCSWP